MPKFHGSHKAGGASNFVRLLPLQQAEVAVEAEIRPVSSNGDDSLGRVLTRVALGLGLIAVASTGCSSADSSITPSAVATSQASTTTINTVGTRNPTTTSLDAASNSTTTGSTSADEAATTTDPAPSSEPAPTSGGEVGDRFELIPVGAALPTEEECAARVRRGQPEVRPQNVGYNATAWGVPNERYPRATGNFTGTTDEIIQWAACKWGIDEDVLRAQVVKESYWDQRNLGDWTTSELACIPGHTLGADGRDGECPESVGILQVRSQYHFEAIEGASVSTAYNIDYTLAVWRTCFEGGYPWFNDYERGGEYAAGDMWGCVGSWFAGRWKTDPANVYIAAVQEILRNREWERPWFLSYTG